MWQIKAGIALAILAALGFVLWRNEALTKKLNAANQRVAVAEAQTIAEQKAREQDARFANEIDKLRVSQETEQNQFVEILKAHKVTREVRYVTQTGETVSCVNRDPVIYRGLFNSALSGEAPDTGSLFPEVQRQPMSP